MYSKRRTNLGRRSKKSSNRTLTRLRGSSSSSVESHNYNDELPEGYSPVKVATWYPEGTTILKINKAGERLPIITLNQKRILQLRDLGDEIIGVKKPTVIPPSSKSHRKRQKDATKRLKLEEEKKADAELAKNEYGTQTKGPSKKSVVNKSSRIPKGYSLPIAGFQYPVGTIVRIIDKDNNEEKDIELDLPRYLAYFYLGNIIIGVKN